jgi:PilZ domain
MDMGWKPSTAADNDSTREPRMAKLVALHLSSARYDNVKIVVRNLSPHGLGARADIELLPCERVVVHLPDGQDVGAIVRWVRKNTFGLSLDERIEPAQLQPKPAAVSAIVPRDAEIGFNRLRHTAGSSRSGFQRSHRDEVLRTSSWMGER